MLPSSTLNTISETTTKDLIGDWRSKTFSWSKMCGHFMLENSEEGDVIFLVGEEQEEIKTFKLFLRVASRVLHRAFSTDWDHSDPILLPDIEPKAFRQFLKLIFVEEGDSSTLKSLDLPLDEIFSILYISKKYDVIGVTQEIFDFLEQQVTFKNALYIYEHVVSFDDDRKFHQFVTENFEKIISQDEFLQVSIDLLAELLKSNELRVDEADLFKALCRWGKFQFNQQKEKEEDEIPIPISGEDMRKTLGQLFPLIRFPLFSAREFVNQVPKGLLSLEETLSNITYIVRNNEERKEMLLQNPLPFVVECRESNAKMSVSYEADSTNDLFICEQSNKIDVDILSASRALKIRSFGFHGPKDDSIEYNVTVICKMMDKKEPDYVKKTYKRTIVAQKNQLFTFYLVPPFLIKPNDFASRTRISIYLEGAASLPSSIMAEKKTTDNVEFFYNYGKPGPLAEIECQLIKTDESTLSPPV